jgi:hypothetical protein
MKSLAETINCRALTSNESAYKKVLPYHILFCVLAHTV